MKTPSNSRVFIFAGELSGDLHGGALIKGLKSRIGDLSISGVGGPDMRRQGLTGPLRMEDFMVMGFSDVLKSLPRLLWQYRQVRSHILQAQPDAAIFIDSPSFSLPMAKSLKKAGFKGKIIQYICPTVWAWGKHRIQQMADTFDLLLTIFPFEAQHFANTSLRVEYVGNPLQEAIQGYHYRPQWKTQAGIDPSADILALFPGSRTGEILRNLPSQLEAAKMLRKIYPETAVAVSCAQDSNKELIQKILQESKLENDKDIFCIPKEFTYDLMQSCRSAIAKSGTVTLELALHQCPTVVTYKLSWLNKMIAQYALKVNLPHYCIVNILADACVFPELITEGCPPEEIHRRLLPLYEAGAVRDQCLAQCRKVLELLQETDSSRRAAHAIVETLGDK